jgi:cytochrome c-type biogenesis protein CcmH/NrfG
MPMPLGRIGGRLRRFDLADRACAQANKLIGEAPAITPAHRGKALVAQEAERKAQGLN